MKNGKSKVMTEVLAVVVNWNGKAHLKVCLDSLASLDYAKNKWEVMVIDNGSQDGSEKMIPLLYPRFNLVKNTKNIGFAGAENQAVRFCREKGADFLWILNNDVRVAEDALSRLIDAARSDDKIAVISPAVYDDRKRDRIDSAGYKIDLWTGRFRKVRPEDGVTDVDSVQGCAALMRASVFDSAGLFPDTFHAYFEESDLHQRIKRAGYRIVTVKNARVWHKRAASYSRVPVVWAFFLLRNLILFEIRNARPVQLLVFVPFFILVHLPLFVLRGGLFAARSIWRRLKN